MDVFRRNDLSASQPDVTPAQRRQLCRCIHADDLQDRPAKKACATVRASPNPPTSVTRPNIVLPTTAVPVEVTPKAGQNIPWSLRLGANASTNVELQRSDSISVAQLVNRGETTDAIRAVRASKQLGQAPRWLVTTKAWLLPC